MQSTGQLIMILSRCFIIGLCLYSGLGTAATFEYARDHSVVGEVTYTYSTIEQTLPDIARIHDLGYNEIKRTNPDVDTWLPGERTKIILPKRFVLPVVPHDGIVVNIPEMRLYYFPPVGTGEKAKVITHPIGIGREGWSTPYVTTRIIQKKENPSWYPPDSIRAKYAAEGTILPDVVKPGPENPLGAFAMRLGLPAYLIHGTNRPYGVGMRVSSGCIRLYPEDIESLFSMVPMETRVRIVNQPYKVGVMGRDIFLEANPFLEEDAELFDGNLTSVVKMLVNLSDDVEEYDVDWELAKQVINERKGEPVRIGRFLGNDTPLVASETADIEGRGMKDAMREVTIEPMLQQHALDLILETGLDNIQ